MNILFLAALSLSAICLAALNTSAGQDQSVSSSETEHVSPFACNAFALSPQVRKRHFEELGPALLKLKKSIRELPDGYEFELPADNTNVSAVNGMGVPGAVMLSVLRYRPALRQRKRTAMVTSDWPARD